MNKARPCRRCIRLFSPLVFIVAAVHCLPVASGSPVVEVAARMTDNHELELIVKNNTDKSVKANVGLEAKLDNGWIEVQSDFYQQALDKKAKLYELVPLSTLTAIRAPSKVLTTLNVNEVEVRAVVVVLHEKPIYSQPIQIKKLTHARTSSAQ